MKGKVPKAKAGECEGPNDYRMNDESKLVQANDSGWVRCRHSLSGLIEMRKFRINACI
jgi:hypothetical protein